jgi:hypothetical protein
MQTGNAQASIRFFNFILPPKLLPISPQDLQVPDGQMLQ